MHTAQTLLALALLVELRDDRLGRIATAARRHQHRKPFGAMTCPTCNPDTEE